MNDERPPSLWWGMWKRFFLAGILIVALSGAATATVALNKLTTLADEVFPQLSHINAPKGLITPEYGGGPQTFLILGSDRRAGSKNIEERESAPHSDTILLVRFDPEQGQTSVLSIPRDLMVNIRTPSGQVYEGQKINAAYTIGSKFGGANGASVLAAETIVREVFPELQGKLNGIIDVNFAGFIKVVDALGCAYVNVDHRYLHLKGESNEEYTEINLEPGYQKLCYENALDYVRYRHTDSDFVRVARQQDFLRDLREQIDPANELGQIDTVAKAVGRAIRTNFPSTPEELVLLSKLIAFSQSKPLRQVKFLASNVDYQPAGGGDYVTSNAELEKETLDRFLYGKEQLALPASGSSTRHRPSHNHHSSHHGSGFSPAALNLVQTTSAGESELVQAAPEVPFPVLYPTLQTGQSEQQQVRAYPLKNQQNVRHHAYIIVWAQNATLGGYYDFEGSDWLNPPLFAHARTQVIDRVTYEFVDDGSHIHVIGWRAGNVLYWLTNTLLEELSNSQMLAIAKSAQPLH
ncbi:MAG: LCP family protein [Solirubrobacteraceae bacterium]|jgi:LCP family protein required for cell wall assembly